MPTSKWLERPGAGAGFLGRGVGGEVRGRSRTLGPPTWRGLPRRGDVEDLSFPWGFWGVEGGLLASLRAQGQSSPHRHHHGASAGMAPSPSGTGSWIQVPRGGRHDASQDVGGHLVPASPPHVPSLFSDAAALAVSQSPPGLEPEAEHRLAALHQFSRFYTDPVQLGKDLSDSTKLRVVALGSVGFQRT